MSTHFLHVASIFEGDIRACAHVYTTMKVYDTCIHLSQSRFGSVVSSKFALDGRGAIGVRHSTFR